MKGHNIKRRDFLKSVGVSALCGNGVASVILGSGAVIADDGYLLQDNEFSVNKSVFANEKSILLNHPELEYPISLLRIDEANYSALLMSCTHQRCATEWNKDHYVCPCHGSRFTETGAVIRGMAQENLKSFPVEILENRIIVKLSPD